MALDPPGACSTVIIRASLPGLSGRSFDISGVTLGSCAAAVPVMKHSRTNATRLIVMVASFAARNPPATAGEIPGAHVRSGSGGRLRAAAPFAETQAATAPLAERHTRGVLAQA